MAVKLSDAVVTAFALVAITCSVALTTVSVRRIVNEGSTDSQPIRTSIPAQTALTVGSRVPGLPDAAFKEARRTFVLVFRQDCVYCRGSLPFYQRLTDVVERSGGNSKLDILSPDEYSSLGRFLLAHQVRPEHIASLRIESIGVTGTPTLFLCDSSGKIIREWIGRLDPSREEEVIAEASKAS